MLYFPKIFKENRLKKGLVYIKLGELSLIENRKTHSRLYKRSVKSTFFLSVKAYGTSYISPLTPQIIKNPSFAKTESAKTLDIPTFLLIPALY